MSKIVLLALLFGSLFSNFFAIAGDEGFSSIESTIGTRTVRNKKDGSQTTFIEYGRFVEGQWIDSSYIFPETLTEIKEFIESDDLLPGLVLNEIKNLVAAKYNCSTSHRLSPGVMLEEGSLRTKCLQIITEAQNNIV